MHQNVECISKNLANYCLVWDIDSISLDHFIFISNNHGWTDYNRCIKLVDTFFSYIKSESLKNQIIVTPTFHNENYDAITYSVTYDLSDRVYITLDILHDMRNSIYTIMVYIYDARNVEKNQKAYHGDFCFGPFIEGMPLNSQEMYEECRKASTMLQKFLMTSQKEVTYASK